MKSRSNALGFCVVALVGCSPSPANVGQSPEVTWWTDHESGDLGDWSQNKQGGSWTLGGGTVEVAAGIARSGNHALRATVRSHEDSARSAAIALRGRVTPEEACYSAWFWVPAPVSASEFLLFFKFRSRTNASDYDTSVEVWDFNVVPNRDGALVVSVHRHDTDEVFTSERPTLPIGRWFQLEACLRAASDKTGRLILWVDGVTTFERAPLATMPSQYVEWNVGGVTQGLTPATATVYVDDAAISTHQLGPDFPVFWRGE